MSCFYRNQKVTLTRRQGASTVTAIYDNASTVTIEDYRGVSFLMIQYMDGKKLCSVRYNCADVVSFILTAATPKKSQNDVNQSFDLDCDTENDNDIADESLAYEE